MACVQQRAWSSGRAGATRCQELTSGLRVQGRRGVQGSCVPGPGWAPQGPGLLPSGWLVCVCATCVSPLCTPAICTRLLRACGCGLTCLQCHEGPGCCGMRWACVHAGACACMGAAGARGLSGSVELTNEEHTYACPHRASLPGVAGAFVS